MAAGKICKRGSFSHPTKEDTMHGTYHFSGKMLIGGKLVESIDGKWLDSINPADETKLGRVPLGSARDMDMAVEAAYRHFQRGQDYRWPSGRNMCMHLLTQFS
jgi:hypothetical protein